MENMTGCLVGEVLDGTPQPDRIVQALPLADTDRRAVECFKLDTGEILLRHLMETAHAATWGTTLTTPEGARIRWRRPLVTDGATRWESEDVVLEVRGVPFGNRSWRDIAALTQDFGVLRRILDNGLQQGDPNVIRIEVAVPRGTAVPKRVAVGLTPGGPQAAVSVVPPPVPEAQRSAASATQGPPPPRTKPSKGKALARVLIQEASVDSSATSVDKGRGGTRSRRAQGDHNDGEVQLSKNHPRKDDNSSRSTRSLRSSRPALMGRAWKLGRLQGGVNKIRGSQRQSRIYSDRGTRHRLVSTQEVPPSGMPEPQDGAGPSSTVPETPAPDEEREVIQVVAEGAAIRRRSEGAKGGSKNPP